MICAQCCGEKRILEIDCPESCPYLRVGRWHEMASENARHLRTEDPVKQQAQARVLDRFDREIMHLEYILARERRSSRDLADKDVAEALDLLLKAYRTEEKGVLYEQTSNNLRVDGLRRRLREVAESYRYPKEDQQNRLRLRDVIECLEFIRGILASHMETDLTSTGYVDFLARTMPRGEEPGDRGSSLIIPG